MSREGAEESVRFRAERIIVPAVWAAVIFLLTYRFIAYLLLLLGVNL